jgi:hypothetical protein
MGMSAYGRSEARIPEGAARRVVMSAHGRFEARIPERESAEGRR